MLRSELMAAVKAAHYAGDYPGCVKAVHRLLMEDITSLEGMALQYATSVPASDRSLFWTAPEGFYPNPDSVEAIFDSVYDRRLWGGGSGAGSDFQHTAWYIGYVQALMDTYNIRSVLDLGCGDWRFSRLLDFSGREYLGLDVVPSVIAANRAAYGAANICFEHADLSAPTRFASCDLILCKDVLQHLSNDRVAAILAKCDAARFVLITNDYHPVNTDCRDGETRPLDISAPPFSFPARPVLRFGVKIAFLKPPENP